ncbi:uncharacterized protein [Typha latifolia]|uniref:uncharacterized protein n=1 Tax=Typha latifolia TaxID=4733 RepID=UPI003C2F2D48
MAFSSYTAAAVIFAAVFSLLSPASARPGVAFHPCNILLISFSADNNIADAYFFRHPSAIFSIYRVITPFHPSPVDLDRAVLIRRANLPAAAEKVGVSSPRNRAKDVVVVAAGLLFGFGCGAVTAAVMYLAWSLVADRYEIYEEEDDDDECPKKAGYVQIPAADMDTVKEGYGKN